MEITIRNEQFKEQRKGHYRKRIIHIQLCIAKKTEGDKESRTG